MRPNQGPRRSRRNGGGHSHGGGGGHSHGNHSSHSSHSRQPRSAMSLRNQIFDSNGPDTRVRGNAFQVHEKYQALAKDALSSGDRILAENYLQHAEHYFRIIEAINEATAAEQRTMQQPVQQPGFMSPPPGGAPQQQPMGSGNGFYSNVGDMGGPQGTPQAPMGAMRGPVTMESAAMPSDRVAEGEEEPMSEGPQAAAIGRR